MVSLSGLPRREAMIKAPLALHIHLASPTEPAGAGPGRPDVPLQPGPARRRFGQDQGPAENPYPRVLMGSVAHLRQAMLDADYYQTLLSLNEGGSDSRPPYDPALRTLGLARKKNLPVWWEADTRDEIHRALDLAAEFGTTAVIVGGREAAKVIDRLKAEHVAVVLRLNFREEPAGPFRGRLSQASRSGAGRAAEASGPAQREVEGAGRHGRCAGQGGHSLWAGQRWTGTARHFPGPAPRLIAAGLTADQALEALTVDAAADGRP